MPPSLSEETKDKIVQEVVEKKLAAVPTGANVTVENMLSDKYVFVDNLQHLHLHASGFFYFTCPRRFGKSMYLAFLQAFHEANPLLKKTSAS